MSLPNTMKTLIFNHIGETAEDDARVALSPGSVKMLASRDIRQHDRDLKQVTIHFADAEVLVFTMSWIDLESLEQVIAGYDFGMC